jgi:ADP-heptose:LPS heptosyltransferase
MVEGWKALPRPLVALHPGCKPDPEWRARKVYPRWYEVVHRLKQFGATVVVVGSRDDEDLYVGEPNLDARPNHLTLAGTADVLACCDVVLSGDSGVHHLAVALGLPTVAVFGDSSDVKARHLEPAGLAPVVLGPFRDAHSFASVSPKTIARACLLAVRKERAA